MKRTLIAFAALTLSGVGIAEDLDGYASVLNDDPAPFIEYRDKAPTWLENHGSVLLDPVPQRQSRALDIEISVGDTNESLFDTDTE